MCDILEGYVKDIHPRLVRHLFLQLCIWANDHDYEIFEYDVQSVMSRYLNTILRNTDYESIRERAGKFDCVVRRRDAQATTLLYELKTFIKPTERVTEKALLKDIKKLADRCLDENPPRTYFIMAAKRGTLFDKKAPRASLPGFLYQHLDNNRKQQTVRIERGDGVANVVVRPSIKEVDGAICVLSWEVLASRG